ncbi:MAG: VanZ family protein [Candidatus Omnitrophota bacterium]|nr:VanZ family protein [Candidatus Omnitrophota bacterium]
MVKLTSGIFVGLWLPVILYALVIFTASSFPQPEMPVSFWNFDKILHLAEYGLFGILLARAIKGTSPEIKMKRLYFLALLVAFAYGISDEFHQSFVPGRTVSIWDALIDGAGGFLGALFLR